MASYEQLSELQQSGSSLFVPFMKRLKTHELRALHLSHHIQGLERKDETKTLENTHSFAESLLLKLYNRTH